jgi:hypothetical protein
MARKTKHRSSTIKHLDTYWDRTQWPLQSLYFLLPVLLVYEIGTLVYAPEGGQRLPPIVAERLLGQFFEMFGVAGYYLPAIIVVVVLLAWHLARRDPWRPEPPLYALMWIESILLAAPLFVFALVLFREPQQIASAQHLVEHALPNDPAYPYQAKLVFSIGAGIYEELLFRLIAIALVHMLLVDVLALPDLWGGIGAVGASAVAFAMYHFTGEAAFHWGYFFFYTVAGVYLAAIYVLRGFGIVAVTHAVYDVFIETAKHLHG